MEVNILIDEEFAGRVDAAWLKDLSVRILSLEKAPKSSELGLFITGDERIRELNREYLGEDSPTDVLSFAMHPGEPLFVLPPDGIWHLGEVIIAYPQAAVQAKEQGHSVSKEIAILLIHGILHILGYDHETSPEEKKMREREMTILDTLGDLVR